jgi:hypothetical protein
MTKAELDGISETTYDRWADGGRAVARRIEVDPETAATIRKALGMSEEDESDA